MTRKWKKLGRLYNLPANSLHKKLISHTANPLPIHLEGDIYRIFYSSRDADKRSSVGAVDIDIVTRQIIKEHQQPFFEHGSEGSFYADGVSIGNCYTSDNATYMLFMGWQNTRGGQWRGDIGRLIVKPDLTLELDSSEPFMGADKTDPISLSYPWVTANPKGGYFMWYGSTDTWDAGNGEMLHTIKYASSLNGHDWRRHGNAIPYEIGTAQAFSHPTVIGNADSGFEMWFSFRSGCDTTYRIGYATSLDGINWTLDLANAGIDVSSDGWDSEMIEYPYVFTHNNQTYMLYNGNGYGRSGFGLAIRKNK